MPRLRGGLLQLIRSCGGEQLRRQLDVAVREGLQLVGVRDGATARLVYQ